MEPLKDPTDFGGWLAGWLQRFGGGVLCRNDKVLCETTTALGEGREEYYKTRVVGWGGELKFQFLLYYNFCKFFSLLLPRVGFASTTNPWKRRGP